MYVKRNVGEKKIKIKLKVTELFENKQGNVYVHVYIMLVRKKKKKVKFSESRDEHTKINVMSLYSVYWEEICQKLFNEQ